MKNFIIKALGGYTKTEQKLREDELNKSWNGTKENLEETISKLEETIINISHEEYVVPKGRIVIERGIYSAATNIISNAFIEYDDVVIQDITDKSKFDNERIHFKKHKDYIWLLNAKPYNFLTRTKFKDDLLDLVKKGHAVHIKRG